MVINIRYYYDDNAQLPTNLQDLQELLSGYRNQQHNELQGEYMMDFSSQNEFKHRQNKLQLL